MLRRKRIFWALSGDSTMASSRLHGWMVHRYLRQRGYASHILYWPLKGGVRSSVEHRFPMRMVPLREGDVLLVQKLDGPEIVELIGEAKRRGAATMYIECDWRDGVRAISECEHLVCPSRHLASRIARQHSAPVTVIPDPIEASARLEVTDRTAALRVVWVGHNSQWNTLDVVRRVLARHEFADWELTTVSDHPEATVRWNLHSVFSVWACADVCVIPTGDDDVALCKSNNRATQAMALGVPVVCGAIPAYEDLAREHYAIVCRTEDDYAAALTRLRDPAVRRELAERAQAMVMRTFQMDVIGDKWQQAILSASGCKDGAQFACNWVEWAMGVAAMRRLRAAMMLASAQESRSFRHVTIESAKALATWPCVMGAAEVVTRALVRSIFRRLGSQSIVAT